MTTSKFPHNLISEMWNSNVRFDKILHIPTLVCSDSERISDEFQEFLGDAYEEWQSAELLKQCPTLESTLKEIRENENIDDYAGEVAQDIYRASGEFEFLILLAMRIPFNFRFDVSGKYISNSLGGMFQMKWILAKSMVHAAEQAIQIADALHQEKEQEARKEQGYV